jgi:hypothetical protein
MKLPFEKTTQRLLAVIALLLPLAATPAFATGPTCSGTCPAAATGNLTVTATVASAIQFEFKSDGSGLSLASGNNTNAATLGFGSITEYGSAPTGTTISTSPTFCTNCWSVSTPVDFDVNVSNMTSSNYTLAGYLSAAPVTGASLSVNNSAALTTSATTPTTIDNAATYGTATYDVSLGLANTGVFTSTINDTIDFVATPN